MNEKCKTYFIFVYPIHIMSRVSTWTKKRIFRLVSTSIIYGIWFNYLDAAAYCYTNSSKICISIGEILGGKSIINLGI